MSNVEAALTSACSANLAYGSCLGLTVLRIYLCDCYSTASTTVSTWYKTWSLFTHSPEPSVCPRPVMFVSFYSGYLGLCFLFRIVCSYQFVRIFLANYISSFVFGDDIRHSFIPPYAIWCASTTCILNSTLIRSLSSVQEHMDR